MRISHRVAMRSLFRMGLVALAVASLLLLTSACAKKKIAPAYVGGSQGQTAAEKAAELARQKELARQQAIKEEQLAEQQRSMQEKEGQTGNMSADAVLRQFIDEDVHFDFDSAFLTPEAQEILKRKAQWLLAHPDARVIVQGHTDERGTVEYNLALGDRRARAVKNFLVDLGVAAQNISTVSYGEERPADPGHDETAWAKNRRAQFVLEK